MSSSDQSVIESSFSRVSAMIVFPRCHCERSEAIYQAMREIAPSRCSSQ
jgi:hypothetical protein